MKRWNVFTYNVLLALSVTIVSSILTYVSRDMLLLLINAWGILSFSVVVVVVVVLELKFANESEKMQKKHEDTTLFQYRICMSCCL